MKSSLVGPDEVYGWGQKDAGNLPVATVSLWQTRADNARRELTTAWGRSLSARRSDLRLLLCQQQLPGLLKSPFEAACNHTEDARQLKLHRYCGVKHIDDARNCLPQPRDAESQPITVPSFAASTRATGQLSDDFREAGFDAASSLAAAELVWDAD
jgi:hypothetical protein